MLFRKQHYRHGLLKHKLPRLLPGIDDCHQLERALVHGIKSADVVPKIISAVRTVVKLFRKSDILSMQLSAME